MPPGGLYAKWDDQARKAVWFYSQERDYMFREPRRDLIIYEEHQRSRFRSLVFRFGDLCTDNTGLCGYVEFTTPNSLPKRYVIHSSFYPEAGIGLWIAITSRDDKLPQGTRASAPVNK